LIFSRINKITGPPPPGKPVTKKYVPVTAISCPEKPDPAGGASALPQPLGLQRAKPSQK
jgi:hypothetical protein